MNSIAIDTSSTTASVAIFDDDNLKVELFLNTGFTHSQTLMPMINSCLEFAKKDIHDINQFIVTIGPGSFTGLRIGIATIKGLTISDNLPCKAVSTIETLAYNLIDFNGIICPTIDARCNQVYAGIFEAKNNIISRLEDDFAISIDDLKSKLKNFYNKDIFLLGNGAPLCYNHFRHIFSHNLHLVSENLRFQKASSAFRAAKNKPTISHFNLVPKYLRIPQAQRQLLKKEAPLC